MLQFVFGRAASGKTSTIHNMIKNDADNGCKNLILLVPEQFSFETERQMLSLLGSGFMSKVGVFSFTRLVEEGGRLYGGIAGIRVNEPERIMLMGSAVKKLSSSLQLFKKYIKSPVFVSQVAAVITEFKTAGITAEDLSASFSKIQNDALLQKIKEITLIYSEYDKLLKDVYIEPLDELEIFFKKAAENKFFKGKTVYIDAFKGFTGEQLKVLKLIILNVEKVVISLCTDNETDQFEGAGLFSNIKKAANDLISYAKENGVEIKAPIYLENSHFANDEIDYLEKSFSGKVQGAYPETAENIVIECFENPTEELDYVFKTVHKLVRTEDYRYKDFVIIARDISKYERRLEISAKKFNVPVFFDRRKPLISSPVARFVLSLLKAAENFNTNDIFSLLKTGFFGLSTEEIADLEEYTFTWGITGRQWLKEWDMFTGGLVADPEGNKILEDKPKVLKLNETRKKVVLPLIALNKELGSEVSKVTASVYKTLISLKVDDAVRDNCEEFKAKGDLISADFLMESWDKIMDSLDSVVRCFNGECLDVKEYTELLNLAITGATVGTIPRMIDEVSCGSADRIRPARPKVVFAIGLCLGEFPARLNDGGLLLKNDRTLMEKADIPISDRFRQFVTDENFLVYSALCCASERVYALNHRFELDGTLAEESSVIATLKNLFPNTKKISEEVLPETLNEGLENLLENYYDNSCVTETLKEYFSENERAKEETEKIRRSIPNNTHRLSDEVLDEVFSKDLFLSPTGIENYNKCAFSYFCKYVLGVSAPEKAELNPIKRGTIAHFVLEKVISQLGKEIANTAEEIIFKMTDNAMEEYLSNIAGGEIVETPRFKFLYKEIAKMLKYVLKHISLEFQNCDFEPVGFEVNIGDEEEIPQIEINFTADRKVILKGQIDRVDILKEGGNYVRIVDYKTGGKSFFLSDVLYGLNLQMLLYLFALNKNGEKLFGKTTPAGILYMPAKRGLVGANGKDPLAMNGMLIEDKEVILAMDKSGSDRFIPKLSKKGRRYNPNISGEDYDAVLRYVERSVSDTAEKISKGIFDINPMDFNGGGACDYCDFAHICKIQPDSEKGKVPDMETEEVIIKMKEVLGDEN